VELAIPKLRQGSYFPSFLEHRRRAERALASVVATSYLLGVSTRRVEKLAASLGVVGLSKSQVSAMAGELDELAASFRSRPLDAGPYTFVWIDALTQKVREGGRTVRRLVRHMPKKKAQGAVMRTQLVAAHALLSDPEAEYRELGPGYYDQRASAGRQARGHIRSLERLGYKVTLEPVDPDTGELTAQAG